MKVGEYIKSLRLNKDISQEELGKIIGVKRAAVQKWESEVVQNLKRTTIKKLSEYFNVCPANFIFDDVPETQEANCVFNTASNCVPLPDTNKQYTHTEENLISNFRLLNSKGQEIIIDTIDMALTKHKKDVAFEKESEYRIVAKGAIGNEDTQPPIPEQTT